ncbi:MAG: prepilin-type N-terminal cleavage/methylation domain-containing protein [Myxococcaceae bacterium]
MRKNQRGYTLLTAMVVVLVITILVAAAVMFTGREAASASQHKRREAASSCAVAARNWALSQIQGGVGSRLNNTNITGALDTGEYTIVSGHIDDPSDGGTNAVAECPRELQGGAAMDLTNTTLHGLSGPGGRQCYRIVASCRHNQTGDVTEVEFMVRLAL